MTPARWLLVVVLLAALVFAFQGGEFSTTALMKLRADERTEAAAVKDLRRRVDSLTRYVKQVETDPETQERIAREQHGMLKRGEHAFILEEADDRQP